MTAKQSVTALSNRVRQRIRSALHPVDPTSRYEALTAYRSQVDPALVASESLTRFESQVFSQNGEDGILAEIFARIGVEHHYFIEFGIETGREGNSVTLADVLGWSGIFIEADPDDFAELSRKYSSNPRVRTWNEFVTPDNVNTLFADPEIPRDLDLLSIDIDGNDIWVWEAVEVLNPRLVVIEYNGELLPEATVAQAPTSGNVFADKVFAGSALGALDVIAERKGYRLVYTDLTGVNAFYLRADLWEAARVTDVPRRRANYAFAARRWPVADVQWIDLAPN